MDKIDPTLAKMILSDPQSAYKVLISCTTNCQPVLDTLSNMGVAAGKALLALNIITASMTGPQIEEVAASPAVERIELDDEAKTQ